MDRSYLQDEKHMNRRALSNTVESLPDSSDHRHLLAQIDIGLTSHTKEEIPTDIG